MVSHCEECESIEGGIEELEDGTIKCKQCGGEECVTEYDEDYGQDR